LSLGYRSSAATILVLAGIAITSYRVANTFGLSLAAVGMMSTIVSLMTIAGFGPICDNAGGMAELAFMSRETISKANVLDAAGNTASSIAKGSAIGSAAIISLALLGAFVARIRLKQLESGSITDTQNLLTIEVMQPVTFTFLLIGASLPYWFSAMTLRAVGDTSKTIVGEVEAQIALNPEIFEAAGDAKPDYNICIKHATRGSLVEMIAPGTLVVATPLLIGSLFGVHALCGLLIGSLVSSVTMAMAMTNSGAAWDNAKKSIAQSEKDSNSAAYEASVLCDTVGDPLKDTSGPSLNILMKLMAIIAVVFAEYFYAINEGKGWFNISPI